MEPGDARTAARRCDAVRGGSSLSSQPLDGNSGRNRVLLVVNHARWFLTHRLSLGIAAREAGLDFQVASPPGEYAQQIVARGFSWHSFHLSRGGRKPWAEARTFLDLQGLYRTLSPDLVHHVTAKPILYGTLAARFAGVPSVVNAVTGLGHLFLSDRFEDSLARTALSAGNRVALRHPRMRVIFQNAEDRDLYLQQKWIRPDNAVLIEGGAGVDVTRFQPATRPDQSVPIVLVATRMLYTKGISEFVEAARILKKENASARFVLVGEPDPENPASIPRSQIERWVAEGVVEAWGHQEEMPAVVIQASIACLPSYREGTSKFLLEAAASGIPAVTTDVPGCRDVVTDGIEGLLVPARNPVLLADALRRLLVSPRLREQMGRAARQRAVEKFSVEKVSEATIRVYRELLR